jgi:hypothetical protein
MLWFDGKVKVILTAKLFLSFFDPVIEWLTSPYHADGELFLEVVHE